MCESEKVISRDGLEIYQPIYFLWIKITWRIEEMMNNYYGIE